jgi:hypothetical protein
MDDYSAHIRDLIEVELPDNAQLLMPRGWRELLILVSWRLPVNSSSSRARAHILRIVVSGVALADYTAGSAALRAACDQRLAIWLRTQISEFDVQSFESKGPEHPAVTWQVESQQLFG